MYILGKKVILRAIEEEDNEMLRGMLNDPQIERAVGGWSFPVSRHAQMEWFKKQGPNPSALRCIIETLEDKQAVGLMSLTNIDYKNGTAECNGKLIASNQGKGYGPDAHRAMFKYAFCELRLNCIYANILESNIASIKMFDKLGLKREGVLRQRVYKQGKYENVVAMSLLKSEFNYD